MEKHDALVTSRHGFEPALERVDLGGGLLIDLAEERLAEVRDLRSGEASDESLRPDDSDFDLPNLEDRVPALEHEHAAARELLGDLVRTAGVVVVVPEHRDDRNGDAVARVGEHRCLLG